MPSDIDSKIMTGSGFGHSWAEMKAYVASQIEALPQAPQQILPIPHAIMSDIPDSPNKLLTIQNNFTGYGNVSVHWKRDEDPTASDPTVDLENGTEISVTGDIHVRALPGEGNTSVASPSKILESLIVPETWNRVSTSPSFYRSYDYGTLIVVNDDLYASDPYDLYVSHDKGNTWTRLQTNLDSLGAGHGSGRLFACLNGVFVLVDKSNSYAYRSTDAETWEKITIQNARYPLYNIVAGDGRFVICDYYGTGYTSTDGLNWTSGTKQTPVSYTTTKLFSANDKFYQVASYSSNPTFIYYSTDGLVWSQVNLSVDIGNNTYIFIAYGNGKYLLSARDDGIFQSIDGINFTRVSHSSLKISGDSSTFWPYLIHYSEKAQKWVNIADGSGVALPCYSRDDGETWIVASKTRFPSGIGPTVLYIDDRFVTTVDNYGTYSCINS